MLLSQGGSSLQRVPTLPEPQFCLRVTLASGAWISHLDRGVGWGESLGIRPGGSAELWSPPSTQSASRCLASAFSLTSEGAWRTWRVCPVPDPRTGLARRGWRGGSAVVEEATAPSVHPHSGRGDSAACRGVCTPWMRAEHKAHGPEQRCQAGHGVRKRIRQVSRTPGPSLTRYFLPQDLCPTRCFA